MFECDPVKDQANRQKHRVPLALGVLVVDHRIGQVEDTSDDYGKRRLNAFSLIEGRLFVCT